MSKTNSNTDDKACFYSEEENGETGNEMFAADQLPRLSFFSRSSLAPFGLASHAGVFRGARFSSLPKNEKRAPLKMPAWEATFGLIVVKKARDFTIPADLPISESGTGSLCVKREFLFLCCLPSILSSPFPTPSTPRLHQ